MSETSIRSTLAGLKRKAQHAKSKDQAMMYVDPDAVLSLFEALDASEQRVAREIRMAFVEFFEGKPMTADRASMFELTRGLLNREVQIRTPMRLRGSSQETTS